MKSVTVWETEDGTLFRDKSQALKHENSIKYTTNDKFVDKFLKGYQGKSLLEKYDLETEGVWEVFGEDKNCDLSGPRSIPRLGIYSGKLIDVIEKAVHLDNFWSWGYGGYMVKRDIEAV